MKIWPGKPDGSDQERGSLRNRPDNRWNRGEAVSSNRSQKMFFRQGGSRCEVRWQPSHKTRRKAPPSARCRGLWLRAGLSDVKMDTGERLLQAEEHKSGLQPLEMVWLPKPRPMAWAGITTHLQCSRLEPRLAVSAYSTKRILSEPPNLNRRRRKALNKAGRS
jgi:hypothetical protein